MLFAIGVNSGIEVRRRFEAAAPTASVAGAKSASETPPTGPRRKPSSDSGLSHAKRFDANGLQFDHSAEPDACTNVIG